MPFALRFRLRRSAISSLGSFSWSHLRRRDARHIPLWRPPQCYVARKTYHYFVRLFAKYVARLPASAGDGGYREAVNPVRAPYSLEIIESCLSCAHREERLFCNLPPAAVKDLAAITSSAVYPKGATLFVEGQAPRGVFILCSGKIKLSTTSADGRTLILRIAEPGEVLGLPATITGKSYELTADVTEPSQANFVSRTDFLQFLRQHGEAALRVAQQLGETYHAAISEMRMIGLSHSAEEKLARFLLDQSAEHEPGKDQVKFTLAFTHEEMGQMIGATRETVSRLFSDFKRKGLVQVKGSALTIPSRAALGKIVNP